MSYFSIDSISGYIYDLLLTHTKMQKISISVQSPKK